MESFMNQLIYYKLSFLAFLTRLVYVDMHKSEHANKRTQPRN